MARRSSQSALTDEFERFQELVRRMAVELTQAMIRSELQRRIFDLKATLVLKPRRPRPRKKTTIARVPQTKAVVVAPVRAEASATSDSRPRWTRDSIITELAA